MRAVTSNEVSLLDYLNDVLGMGLSKNYLPRNISCPLHTDKKPSLRLYKPENRDGYCFSCGKSYTAVTMHQNIHGCSFWEANSYIANTFGIDVSDKDNTEIRERIDLSLEIYKNVKLIKEFRKIKTNFRILEKKAFYDFKNGEVNKLKIKKDRQ